MLTSIVCLCLFALVKDDLTGYIQDEDPVVYIICRYIILIDETTGGIKYKLELWREALEGFKLSSQN